MTKLEKCKYLQDIHEKMVLHFLNKLIFNAMEKMFAGDNPYKQVREVTIGVTEQKENYNSSVILRDTETLKPIRLADGSFLTFQDIWNVFEKHEKLCLEEGEAENLKKYKFFFKQEDLLSFLNLEEELKARSTLKDAVYNYLDCLLESSLMNGFSFMIIDFMNNENEKYILEWLSEQELPLKLLKKEETEGLYAIIWEE